MQVDEDEDENERAVASIIHPQVTGRFPCSVSVNHAREAWSEVFEVEDVGVREAE